MPIEGKDLLEGCATTGEEWASPPHFPVGRPLGEPGNAGQRRVMVKDALAVITAAREPAAHRALACRWRRDDCAAILKRRGGA